MSYQTSPTHQRKNLEEKVWKFIIQMYKVINDFIICHTPWTDAT